MKKIVVGFWLLAGGAAGVARAEDAPDYLSFTATDGDVTIGMKWSDPRSDPTKIHTFEWSADKANWTEFLTGSSNVTVHAGETVYFRRKGEEKVTTLNPGSETAGWQFTMAPKPKGATIAAGGNVMSLLDASCEQTEVGAYAFFKLFYNCTSLTAAPKLPATTLAQYCYCYMFFGCTALKAAPELPATELAESCYCWMFRSCTSLTAAPELPATTLVRSCYESMFYNCTSLTAAPKLPATTLADICYSYMFSGCTALTAAPELPATTLADSCYYGMFYGCTALGWIKVGFTAWDGSQYSTGSWVNGVPTSGLFVCPSELDDQRGSDYIPSGWTKVDADSVRFVIVPKVEHLKTAVTTNGSAVTALEYVGFTRWMVKAGAAVQVEFSADEGWEVKGTTSYSIDSLTDDITFGTTEGYPLPEVIEAPVGKWTVGEDVRATLYVSGDLEITGTGAMYDFASAEEVPWAAFVGAVTAVTIEEGVTHVGKNAFAGMTNLETINGEDVDSTYRTVSTVNGKSIEQFNMMGGALGNEPLVYPPATPAPAPEPPEGAVTTWVALTNAIATAESGAEIAVGDDIDEESGVLSVPKGKAVAIKLYGKTVSCGRVTVGGALRVGDAEDPVGRIVASGGATVAAGGSITLLGGPMRGTFTAQSPGLYLLFR